MTMTLNPPPRVPARSPACRTIHVRACGWAVTVIERVMAVRALLLPPCQNSADGRHCKTAATSSTIAMKRKCPARVVIAQSIPAATRSTPPPRSRTAWLRASQRESRRPRQKRRPPRHRRPTPARPTRPPPPPRSGRSSRWKRSVRVRCRLESRRCPSPGRWGGRSRE